MTRPLLVLRPEPGAAASVARAAALGLQAISVPLFAVAPLAWDAPDAADFDALMLTSANAPRHAGPALLRYAALPAFAVGAATAAAARAAGLGAVETGPGDAAALIAALAARGVARILHLCGADVREAATPGVSVTRVAVYRAAEIAAPEGLAAALALAPVTLVHSPRAARRLAALAPRRDTIAIAAISEAAAMAAGEGWQALCIADAPDDAAMLALAARMCEQGPASRGTV